MKLTPVRPDLAALLKAAKHQPVTADELLVVRFKQAVARLYPERGASEAEVARSKDWLQELIFAMSDDQYLTTSHFLAQEIGELSAAHRHEVSLDLQAILDNPKHPVWHH